MQPHPLPLPFLGELDGGGVLGRLDLPEFAGRLGRIGRPALSTSSNSPVLLLYFNILIRFRNYLDLVRTTYTSLSLVLLTLPAMR